MHFLGCACTVPAYVSACTQCHTGSRCIRLSCKYWLRSLGHKTECKFTQVQGAVLVFEQSCTAEMLCECRRYAYPGTSVHHLSPLAALHLSRHRSSFLLLSEKMFTVRSKSGQVASHYSPLSYYSASVTLKLGETGCTRQ